MRRHTYLSALLFAMAQAALAAAPRMSAEEVRALQLNRGFEAIVDVRLGPDYEKGHIQGARSMPDAEVLGADWKKAGKTLVYCAEDPCPITEKALERLKGMGYTDLVVLGGGFGSWLAKGYPTEKGSGKAARPAPGRMAAAAARARVKKKDLVVVDVRAAKEYGFGHLPTARSAPLEELAGPIPGVAKDDFVLVYDKDAARSRRAADILMDAGYKVSELTGGVGAWIRKGYELEVR